MTLQDSLRQVFIHFTLEGSSDSNEYGTPALIQLNVVWRLGDSTLGLSSLLGKVFSVAIYRNLVACKKNSFRISIYS